jgi:predicted N-acetyltransferase YhbS
MAPGPDHDHASARHAAWLRACVTTEVPVPTEIQLVPDYRIARGQREEIRGLLAASFPGESFTATRTYLKQIPAQRILAWTDGRMTGHVGIEYRMVGFETGAARAFGIADLCVHPESRSAGLASAMLREIDAVSLSHGIEYAVLFADDRRLYERNGYRARSNVLRWVKMHEHRTIGIACEPVPELMVKELGNRAWPDGTVDLLGHLF